MVDSFGKLEVIQHELERGKALGSLPEGPADD